MVRPPTQQGRTGRVSRGCAPGYLPGSLGAPGLSSKSDVTTLMLHFLIYKMGVMLRQPVTLVGSVPQAHVNPHSSEPYSLGIDGGWQAGLPKSCTHTHSARTFSRHFTNFILTASLQSRFYLHHRFQHVPWDSPAVTRSPCTPSPSGECSRIGGKKSNCTC